MAAVGAALRPACNAPAACARHLHVCTVRGRSRTIDARANNSKGCGGVMRTAPIGLISSWDERVAFDVGARASAITHGHPYGYLSGGAMAALVRLLVTGASLEAAAEQTIEITKTGLRTSKP